MKQEEALDILKLGHNVFLTGPAGSGKTYLLNKYVSYLKRNGIDIAVTATSGLAATHLNGRTIHSWCGMGINNILNEAQINSLREKEYLTSRIEDAKVLIIDEISMLNAERLDLVNTICQAFRQDLRPFGGIQIILCGDLFQLPPVKKHKDEDGRFVIESDIWNNMAIKICYLEEQHRQKDEQFSQLLTDIRSNKTTDETVDILHTRFKESIKGNIKPTKLYTHNRNVDAENNSELSKLTEDEVNYQMDSEGVQQLVENLKNSYCLAPEILRLKIGAVVMFVKNNFSKGYINGTLGKVIGFDEEEGYPIVETVQGKKIIATPERWVIEDDGRVISSISQVPLRLAWAITVHKSQGMSLDCAEIDLGKTFEYGMGYVALSRVKTLDGIKLVGINDLALKVNQEIIKADKKFIKSSRKSLADLNTLSKKEIKQQQKKFIKDNKLKKGIFNSYRVAKSLDDIPF
ncbi:MAG: PIF1 family DEAD/DEAH box helicase [bacterium]